MLLFSYIRRDMFDSSLAITTVLLISIIKIHGLCHQSSDSFYSSLIGQMLASNYWRLIMAYWNMNPQILQSYKDAIKSTSFQVDSNKKGFVFFTVNKNMRQFGVVYEI